MISLGCRLLQPMLGFFGVVIFKKPTSIEILRVSVTVFCLEPQNNFVVTVISARLGDSPLFSRAYCLINSASFCSFSSLMTLINAPQTISELIVLLLYHGKDALSIGLQNFLFHYSFFFVSCGAVSDAPHCFQNGHTRDLYVCL